MGGMSFDLLVGGAIFLALLSLLIAHLVRKEW